MSDAETTCALCGEDVDSTAPSERYCSTGCERVGETLGTRRPDSEENESAPKSDTAKPQESRETALVFLHIDGMHCATCETFLERKATAQAGVIDAAASYVTETIRIEYDPYKISVAECSDALNTVGYSVVPRDELTTVADEQGRRTDERQMDDLLGFRYAAGVLFGVFMMFPYIVVVYPAMVSEFLGIGSMSFFAGGAGPGDAILVLPIFLITTSVVLFFTGLPILRGAYVSIAVREPNLDLLVAVTIVTAYTYGTIAYLAGNLAIYYDLTILIAAVVVAAIFYESLTKQRAVDRLTDLTVSQVSEANKLEPDGSTSAVEIEDLEPNDRVLVRTGGRVPVDGTLENGSCTVDEAVVTGESLPVRKQVGEELLGGSVVTDDGAVLRVGDPPTSSLDGLTSAVWDLQSSTHGIQRWSDRLAAKILPAIALLAVIASAVTVALGGGLLGALFAGLATVLISTPWALGLSTPLSVARSIEAAMERGVIVFDETVFERLRATDTVVFDKTGTLTTGEMEIVERDITPELLASAARLEQHAAHPAGKAIASAAALGTKPDGGTVEPAKGEAGGEVTNVTSHETGIEGTVDGEQLLVGNVDLFDDRGWSVPERLESQARAHRQTGNLPVIIGCDGTAEGLVILGDDPRTEWEGTLNSLSDRGIRTVVLTGDDETATRLFGEHTAVDYVFPGVPPAGKTATIERLRADGHVTMVGDGTNDGPALAAADLGISMGGGTALASEAADLTIVDDDLSLVETAFDLADAARTRLRQNTALAVLYNILLIPLALAGFLNPLFAMAAGLLTAGLVGVNATRPLLVP